MYFDSFWLLSVWYSYSYWYFTAKDNVVLSVAFCEFLSKFTHTGHIYKAGRVLFFCIGANKGLHDFFMKKEFILIFLLLEHCSSLVTGLLTLYAVGHKNKVHGAFVLCGLIILESYIKFRLVRWVIALPTIIQWSFPPRRDLTLKAM